MQCSNCEQNHLYESMLLVRKSYDKETVAAICEDCQKDVLTLKIVLKRTDPKKPFEFEGYLPVESVK